MGGTDDSILLLGILAIGVYAFTQTDMLDFLKTGAKGGGGGGGGGGPISAGGSCPAGGETCIKDDQGRYDCENVTATAYEATWCGTFSGDDLTIKMYGPRHSADGDCCWCVVHVKPDGTMMPGGEGPHPSSNCEFPEKGAKAPIAPCYKAVMLPGPVQEGYALIGGQWKKMFSHKGPCGCSKKSSTKTGNQVTFRSDSNFQTKCATVRPLGGGAAAAAPAKAAHAHVGGMWYPQKQSISTLYQPRYYRLPPTI